MTKRQRKRKRITEQFIKHAKHLRKVIWNLKVSERKLTKLIEGGFDELQTAGSGTNRS
jgi:hypothetical protein